MSLYHTPIASEFQEDRNTGDGSVSVPGVSHPIPTLEVSSVKWPPLI